MARTIQEKVFVEDRTYTNGNIDCKFSVIKRGNLFYLLFSISANFEIDSYFESTSIEHLREEFAKNVILDDKLNVITFNMNENEQFTFSEKLDEDVWHTIRYSAIDISNCLNDLIVGRLLADAHC